MKEPKRVPAGTLVEVVGRWDNSADNPRNPNPGVDLAFGEGTDDEMLVGFVDYVVQEGVRPAPYGVSAELRRILDLRHASADSFVAGAGMMAFGLHLPRSGGGALYMLQGNVLIAADFHDVVWEGDTAYVNSEMLTSSADTMPLGLIVTRPAAGGVEGEMYFGRKVSVAERAALAGSGQSFRGAAVDAGVSAGGR